MRNLYTLFFVTTALSACSLAPDFKAPDMGAPSAYKSEAPADAEQKGEWKPIEPMEKSDRGEWWKIFGDSSLNDLETQAIAANNTLKAAFSRVQQSRAEVRAVASTLFPTIDLGGNAVRSKPATASTAAFGGSGAPLKPYNLYSAGAVASYEVDLFGRVRDSEAALEFDAEGQEALYRSTLLALQADVATHYFTLRSLDAERALLRETVSIRTEAQRIMQKRFDAGSSSEQDLSRTQAELAGAQADLIAIERTRSAYENALAVLLGKMPSEFHFADATISPPKQSKSSDAVQAEPLLDIAPFKPLQTPMPEPQANAIKARFNLQPPQIPAGIPSMLLARRPDIAHAQNAMQAANKRIGVARTAFFPSLNLTVSGGAESTALSDLFQWSSRTWALGQAAGSALAMTLFDNGRTIARVDSAQAEYEAAVSEYRQQVLVAFKDVEDALTDQRLLSEQAVQQDAAAAAARRTTDLTQKRYDQGDTSYFEVVDAQRNSLAAERAAIQTRGTRMTAAVNLIRALGGTWDAPINTTAQ